MIWLVLVWVVVAVLACTALVSKHGELILWGLALGGLIACIIVAILGLAGL